MLQILVLDNDSNRLQVLREVLVHQAKTAIVAAKSSEQALDALAVADFELAVADFSEEGPGWEFVKELRAPDRSPAPGLPVLATVSSVDKQQLRRLIGVGVDQLVVLPFSTNHLISKIQGLLASPVPRFECATYVGPDRRRVPDDLYSGPRRRGID